MWKKLGGRQGRVVPLSSGGQVLSKVLLQHSALGNFILKDTSSGKIAAEAPAIREVVADNMGKVAC